MRSSYSNWCNSIPREDGLVGEVSGVPVAVYARGGNIHVHPRHVLRRPEYLTYDLRLQPAEVVLVGSTGKRDGNHVSLSELWREVSRREAD